MGVALFAFGLVLAIVCFATMIVCLAEDGLRPYLLGRFRPAKPIVKLVADLLAVDHGWSHIYSEWRHSTGVKIYLRYDDMIRDLSVDGSAVKLTNADKLLLKRALNRLKRGRSAIEQDKTAKLLAERAQAFAARAEQFADTVVPFERRA